VKPSGSYCTISTRWPSGSVDHEVGVFDAALGYLVRNLDALGAEIEAHGFGVLHLDGDMEKAVGGGGLFGEEFDVLALVHFDESEGETAIRVV
jgi:hypothetical protein